MSKPPCPRCRKPVRWWQRDGRQWHQPGHHAECALKNLNHDLERSFIWRRPSGWSVDAHPRAPVSWGSWGQIYLRWWQYSPPWACTNWWWFRWGKYCDSRRGSLLVQLPLLGHVVRFRNRACDHLEEVEMITNYGTDWSYYGPAPVHEERPPGGLVLHFDPYGVFPECPKCGQRVTTVKLQGSLSIGTSPGITVLGTSSYRPIARITAHPVVHAAYAPCGCTNVPFLSAGPR
jgi:hypothetical protein